MILVCCGFEFPFWSSVGPISNLFFFALGVEGGEGWGRGSGDGIWSRDIAITEVSGIKGTKSDLYYRLFYPYIAYYPVCCSCEVKFTETFKRNTNYMINAPISYVYPSLKPWCLQFSVDIKVHLNLNFQIFTDKIDTKLCKN